MSAVVVKVTWQQALEQFDNLIKYAARQRVENSTVDCMLSAEDLYQEGLIKLHDCYIKWCVERGKDMEEFGYIFRKSLFRKMKQCGVSKRSTVDIDKAAPILKDPNITDPVHSMHMTDLITTLYNSLSGDAKVLMKEIMSPSPRTLYEVWADTKRKEMLKSQGHRVNIPKDSTVRMKHIMRCLGFTVKRYDNAITELRERAISLGMNMNL